MKKTEKKIIQAARKVFQEKGYEGSRMREIADTAGINKGLLHYYFQTKDNLFEAVFREAMRGFLPKLDHIIETPAPLSDKLQWFIRDYLNFLGENPFLPSFILQELHRDPQLFWKSLSEKGIGFPNPLPLIDQILAETQAGNIRPIDPRHLMVNLVSMCAFPFVARPVFQQLLRMDNTAYQTFLADRKDIIFQTIWAFLAPENP
jgi:TetR/AcrR family transcriptional regulator